MNINPKIGERYYFRRKRYTCRGVRLHDGLTPCQYCDLVGPKFFGLCEMINCCASQREDGHDVCLQLAHHKRGPVFGKEGE